MLTNCKTISFLLLLYFMCFSVSSQNKPKEEQHKKMQDLLSHARSIEQVDADSAIYYANEALSFVKKENLGVTSEINCLRTLGFFYLSFKQDFAKAHECYSDLELIAKKQNNIWLLTDTYLSLSYLYMSLDGGRALSYLMQAENLLQKQIRLKPESKKDLQPVSFEIACRLSQFYMGNYIKDSMIFYLNLAETRLSGINDINKQMNFYSMKSHVASKEGDHQTAANYIRLLCEHTKNIKNWTGLSFNLGSMAIEKHALGNNKEALILADSAYKLACRYDLEKEKGDALGVLRIINEEIGNYKEAYKYINLERQLTDAKFSNETSAKIASLEIRNKDELARFHNEKLIEKEERKNKIQMIGIVVFILTFLMFLLLISKRKVNKKVTKFLGLLGVLLTFEFISLFLHPYIGSFTHHSPVYTLMVLVVLASLLVPLHHKTEHFILQRISSSETNIINEIVKEPDTISDVTIIEGNSSDNENNTGASEEDDVEIVI